MSKIIQDSDQDFNSDDYNSFYYTSDKQIRKLDDKFIMSKIIEKYPDFIGNKSENIIKQVFVAITSDIKFIDELSKKLDMTIFDIFKVIYRNYSFIFNKCFINKIQKIIKANGYGVHESTKGSRIRKFASNNKDTKKDKHRTQKSRRGCKVSKVQSNEKGSKRKVQTKKRK